MRVMKIWFPLNPYLPNIGVFGKMMLRPRQKRKKIVGETSKLRQKKNKNINVETSKTLKEKNKNQVPKANQPNKTRREYVVNIDDEGEEEENIHLT